MSGRIKWAGGFLAGFLLLVTPAPAQKLDNYDDPLPEGAVLRLGSTRLAANGGFTWLADGKTLATARQGELVLWDVTAGEATKRLPLPLPVPERMSFFRYDLACSGDGKKIVCSGRSGQFCVVDLETGNIASSEVIVGRGEYRLENVAINPQGTVVTAVDHSTGKLSIWDATTCKLERVIDLPDRADGLVAPMFTEDGETVAIASRTKLFVVAVDDSRPLVVIAKAHASGIDSFAITGDGSKLISSGRGLPKDALEKGVEVDETQIRIWDVATKQMSQELILPSGMTGSCLVTLTPDEKALVSLHTDRALVWDLAKASIMRTLENARLPNWHAKIQVDPHGEYIAAAPMSKSFVSVWDLATGEPQLSPDHRHSAHITAVAYSRDGRTIATGGADNEVRIWNARTGEHQRTLRNEGGWIRGLQFHEGDSRLLVSAELEKSGLLLDFDVATGKSIFESDLPEKGGSLSLSPNGKLVAVVNRNLAAGGRQIPLRLFDPVSGQQVTDVPGVDSPGFNSISDFHWLDDGESLLAACEDNTVRRFDVKTGKVVRQIDVPHLTISPHSGEPLGKSVHSAAFIDAGRVVTGSVMSAEVICWNLDSGKKAWTIQPPQTSVRQLAASPDGKILACTSSIGWVPYYAHLTLWDVASQRQLADVDLGVEDVHAMTFSPDGERLLLGFTDGSALVYDVGELRE
jgi:WD40 repeat protein